jgi:hypothetical protein
MQRQDGELESEGDNLMTDRELVVQLARLARLPLDPEQADAVASIWRARVNEASNVPVESLRGVGLPLHLHLEAS